LIGIMVWVWKKDLTVQGSALGSYVFSALLLLLLEYRHLKLN